MTLTLAVLTPFFGALLIGLLADRSRNLLAWASGAVALAAMLQLFGPARRVFAGETLIESLRWLPDAGLNLVFRLDGLGLMFAGLILGIGLLVILYARYYLSAQDSLTRLYAYLLLFMGSMLGVVLSENLIQMFIFWELTGLSSFLLIAYWRGRQDARRGARMALTVTGFGGLAMFAGLLLLGEAAGSYELSYVLAAGDEIRADPRYPYILGLILLGIFTKSAQFPFHFWLPHAMAAPTPVSSYLHSATMVKAGVFLLARLFPALSGTPEWSLWVTSAGLATLLVGAVIALFQHDLKGLLAYSTISHLGLITTLFGIGTPLAAVAGVFHIINHATFKAGLFMAAGIIDHETGTRDMRKLAGLWHHMPHTAILAIVAAGAMAGVPLLNGFLSKEMFFAEAYAAPLQLTFAPSHWLLPAVATLAGIFSVAYSLRFVHDVFWGGEAVGLEHTPHEPPRWMRVPVEVLAALCLLVGIVPGLIVGPLLAVAASAVLQTPLPDYSLAIWHGINPALIMSLIALVGGALLYAGRKPLFALQDRLAGRGIDARALFDFLLAALLLSARTLTGLLAGRSLPRMLLFFFVAVLFAGWLGWSSAPAALIGEAALLPIDGLSLTVALIALAATVAMTVLYRQRLVALLLMSAVGLVVSLTFVKFSAPDLALTQLAVEVVSIMLLLLALYFLPAIEPRESLWRRARDAALALAAGLGASALTYGLLTRPAPAGIGPWFVEQSVPGGGGHNVVNVILVDFRGFDTMGEITVLAMAALGIFALLHQLQAGRRLTAPKRDADGRPWDSDRHPVILATFARLLLPLALLVSVFILLRGHQLPGGGFIAGLITAVALISQYLANGIAWTQARLDVDAARLAGTGLAIACGTGLASFAFDHPFLTSTFGHWHLPLIGEVELASAMAFDFGVYLVVVGATLGILAHLGELHRAPADEPQGEH